MSRNVAVMKIWTLTRLVLQHRLLAMSLITLTMVAGMVVLRSAMAMRKDVVTTHSMRRLTRPLGRGLFIRCTFQDHQRLQVLLHQLRSLLCQRPLPLPLPRSLPQRQTGFRWVSRNLFGGFYCRNTFDGPLVGIILVGPYRESEFY